jgi:hypothetical protein
MHPISASRQLANLLDMDPVAARQVKEHLSPERILQLLDLPLEDIETYVRENSPDVVKD